jgi:hypothetical protein
MLRDSDTAMYRAKAMGRNSFAVFDEAMHRRVVATLRLENDLRRATSRRVVVEQAERRLGMHVAPENQTRLLPVPLAAAVADARPDSTP